MPQPVYCTKIVSKLVRTYTDRHGLKDLVREVLGVDLSKQQQSSDWGAATLTDAQLAYAASDVLHLHALREKLDAMLARENRTELAKACFEFLPTRARLDLRRMGKRRYFRPFLIPPFAADFARFRSLFRSLDMYQRLVSVRPGLWSDNLARRDKVPGCKKQPYRVD